MSTRGTIIALSGAKGVYTSALSFVLSELLRWKRAKFSDHIRELAKSSGEDPDDTAVLQRIGQQLVRQRPDAFVTAVLKKADWKSGDNLILDGLRHAEIFAELQKQTRELRGSSSCTHRHSGSSRPRRSGEAIRGLFRPGIRALR